MVGGDKTNCSMKYFHWDQKLHVINFREGKKTELEKLSQKTGGTYKINENFAELHWRIEDFGRKFLIYSIMSDLKLQNSLMRQIYKRANNIAGFISI
jgi:hypothetical protein